MTVLTTHLAKLWDSQEIGIDPRWKFIYRERSEDWNNDDVGKGRGRVVFPTSTHLVDYNQLLNLSHFQDVKF